MIGQATHIISALFRQTVPYRSLAGERTDRPVSQPYSAELLGGAHGVTGEEVLPSRASSESRAFHSATARFSGSRTGGLDVFGREAGLQDGLRLWPDRQDREVISAGSLPTKESIEAALEQMSFVRAEAMFRIPPELRRLMEAEIQSLTMRMRLARQSEPVRRQREVQEAAYVYRNHKGRDTA